MSSMLPISLCRSSETSLEGNNNGFRLRHQWHVLKYMEMCWCRHHWEWQHPGILIWDLICKFQSTVVVITDFLCREIYISIFMYQFLIIWIYYCILHEIFTGFKNTKRYVVSVLIHFLMALFEERGFLLKKQWWIYLLLFPSYHFAGYDYTLVQLFQAVLCNKKDLW